MLYFIWIYYENVNVNLNYKTGLKYINTCWCTSRVHLDIPLYLKPILIANIWVYIIIELGDLEYVFINKRAK